MVVAPESAVKYRRDAERLARLLAAGELRFAFVPTVADEQFRDVIRAIEDCRGDLMRCRHRLGKFLLRRDRRWLGPGSTGTRRPISWLRSQRLRTVARKQRSSTTCRLSRCCPPAAPR